jgi:hypothetical protein
VTKHIFLIFLLVTLLSSYADNSQGKHLFILSGQSNMELLRPEESFKPIIHSKFKEENTIIAKYALGTQPISRWYRDWKPIKGNKRKAEPDLYDSLMSKVYPAIKNLKIATITFIWMQGERDARLQQGEVYEKSL